MSTTTVAATAAPPLPTRRAVPSLTVTLLSGLMAYADSFVLTSLRVAIGTVGRVNGLFMTWLRAGTLLLPLFALAVLWALRRAHRRYGARLGTPRTIAVASLLIVLAGTVVGTAAVAVSAGSSYCRQSVQLQQMQAAHHMAPSAPCTCTGTCEALRSMLAVHVRGVGYASGVLLATNLVLVGWFVSLRGGRLEAATARPTAGG